MMGMETYNGHVRTPADAIILFEACRIGLLPRVQRRLSEKERQSIKSGSVFVWDEREAGMRRWTDGKSWSASRVSGSFLTYREMEGKRGGSSYDKSANREGMPATAEGDSDGGPDGYRYKPDGLMKQSFSITTNGGQHLHLISYYSRSSATAQALMQPTSDPQLRHIRPEKGMYPESTVHEQSTIPAVTRGPMASPGYTHSPHQTHQYGRPPPQYGYPGWAPPSPMHTPPPHPQYGPYYQHAPYQGHSPLNSVHYPPPPPGSYSHQPPPMTAFDRPPPPLSNNAVPPPGPYSQQHQPQQQQQQHGAPPPPPPPSYSNAYPYAHGYSYPPQQGYSPSHGPPPPRSAYDSRTPHEGPPPPQHPNHSSNGVKPDRPDSYQSPPRREESNTQAGAPAPPPLSAPVSSGQTIPSISAMLNDGQPPIRTSSRSPGGTPLARPLQDIPSHKLGFEANRDVQALRNLDKSTFKF
ncbi:cAMP-independent regulatory protein pac2 [Acrodontium crateriforme]|uniref:cAMP-independent regulatory protein pac2 n=1 Tax=Acrodontium crateriforme TaxID=150365 RepID=A0AAQ3M3U8_9PEZI|nr:cAMP-independent regulatory protein pac2 [Acrodontium crateriforme]